MKQLTWLKWLTSPLGLLVLVLVAATAIALLVDVISVTGNQIQTGEYKEDAFDLQVAALPGSGACVDVGESDWGDGPVTVAGSIDASFDVITTDEMWHVGETFCLRRVDSLPDSMMLWIALSNYDGSDISCSPGEIDVDPHCGSPDQGQIADHFEWDFVRSGGANCGQVENPSRAAPLSEGSGFSGGGVASGETLCGTFIIGAFLDHNSALAVQSDAATWTWEIEGRAP